MFVDNNFRKILIRVPNWIGDAVMSLPAISAIKKGFKNSEVCILGKPWVAPIYFNNPMIDRIIEYRSGDLHKGLIGKVRLINQIKRERFEIAILFQNAIEAAILAFLARIPIRVGYNTDLRGPLLTHSVKRPWKRKIHHTEYYLEMIRSSGLVKDVLNDYPNIFISSEEKRWAREFLISNGFLMDKPIVGINPGASYGPAKRWFPERFATVGNELSKLFDASVILFGSSEDVKICREISSMLTGRFLDLSGKTTLRHLISIISQCSVFITNDTGPMHIAAAIGVPVVAIFGSTDPDLTGPVGKYVSIIRKKMDCSPCFRRTCYRNFECMDSIKVPDVINGATYFLKNYSQHSNNFRD
ncbi:MAG: lipopolysaccharide heptosyltransferase II [Candidatus Aenigmatarchaeota archaeon]